MNPERRRHERIAANHLTTVFLPSPDGTGPEEIVGRTLDISLGGVLLEVAGGLAEGAAVTVAVAIDDWLLEVGGVVLRARPVGEGFHETAISFGPLPDGASDLIEAVRTRLRRAAG